MSILFAAAFVFVVSTDPMSDAATYEARLGDDRAGLSVYCGAVTSGELRVEFRTDRDLIELSDRRAAAEWRFDDGEPQKRYALAGDRRAVLVGRDAEAFVAGLRDAKRIRARFAPVWGDDIVMDTTISDPSDAIGRVTGNCTAQ